MKRKAPAAATILLVIFFWATGPGNAFAQALLTGTVTRTLTGTPITGARITVNNQVTWSVAGGTYSLQINPAGTFTVTCSKAGYETATAGPVSFTNGGTVTLPFVLQESTNPPGLNLASFDSSAMVVNLSWQVPSGSYEILYDDGLQDAFTVWTVQGNMNAVRFTPPAWPVKVTGGSVHIGTQGNYQPGSNPFVPLQVAVYDASGPGGMPGAMTGGPFDVLPSAFGWNEFTFMTPVTVSSGNFYLVMIQGGNSPNASGIAVDNTSPQLRSVSRFVTGNGPWVPANGNFMLRALAEGAGGPMVLGDGPGSLDFYRVYRLRQGEEMNPAAWTEIGTTPATTFTDPGWNSFPCGPYRWASRAVYSPNRPSPASLSNIIGKCWTASTTIQVNLSCSGADQSGTFVSLTNLVYPDTSYSATLDTSGEVVFPHVWKGSYQLTVTRFGYQGLIVNLPVMSDTVMNLVLLQLKAPPAGLEVNEKTLVAHWQMPVYSETLFTDDWSAGSFTTQQWTPDPGSNWLISTVTGNPAPCAMFSWSPQLTNYSQSLTSKEIPPCYSSRLSLRYDISLDNFGTTTVNQLAVEAWDGSSWVLLKNYSNAGGTIPWLQDEADVSAFSSIPLKFRFRAYGEDTYDIDSWNIDNIRLQGSEDQQGMSNCILGYNFYLDNMLSGFTQDLKYTIPGTQVQYGNTYTACVRAVYGSGISDAVCDMFTSWFLWPAENLVVTAVENTAELTWTKPVIPDTSSIPNTPPGLTGYVIYRNGVQAAVISDPDVLLYYDTGLNPGTYSYTVTALYDLTPYGFPGQTDESYPAGPGIITISYGRPLPFLETWESGSFAFNGWTFEPSQGNWTLYTGGGNPAPEADFGWEPVLNGYTCSLESDAFDASPFDCATLGFDFDISLEIQAPTGQEELWAEAWYDDTWHKLVSFRNDSSFGWTSRHLDISEAAGKGFRIRFTASGMNSADIVGWHVDNIHLYAVCHGATGLAAEGTEGTVILSWSPPQCGSSPVALNEGFEEEFFPPDGWSQVITDQASTWAHQGQNSPVGVHAGLYSAGVLWDYVHQDEWLIAENIDITGDLVFWSYAFQGSQHNDHYYVKISTDNGNSWSILLDLSALPPYPSPNGYNQWNEPYTVDLGPWLGQTASIAWQAIDGDGQGIWYSWAIDDCSVGSEKLSPSRVPGNLMGYDIYRQDGPQGLFQKITLNPVTDTTYTDEVPGEGTYSYFVTPVFLECIQAENSDTVAVDIVIGIPPADLQGVKIYPVPARENVTVESSLTLLGITVSDITGRTVLYLDAQHRDKVSVPVSTLPQGTYLLRVKTVNGYVMRIISLTR